LSKKDGARPRPQKASDEIEFTECRDEDAIIDVIGHFRHALEGAPVVADADRIAFGDAALLRPTRRRPCRLG
jgi:hypothetical protein